MTKSTATPVAPRVRTGPAPVEPHVSVGIAAAIYFGISLLYFLPAFLPDRHIFGTDYLSGGYFFYHFISERFSSGALPKWVPYVFGGLPLFANPGSTYYPIHVLADLLLPVSKVLPFVFWFQFGVAGLGMYVLATELGCRRWIAFVAGLCFQFTGILMSWVYAGHDGRVIVASLAPLFFFFLHRGIRTGRFPSFIGAAATLGFALLSFQIQNAYYLLLAAAIWAVFCLLSDGDVRRPAALGSRVALGLAAVALGFALAAVNFLPFLDYVSESPRGQEGGRGYEYSVSYSMPPGEIISLAVPEHIGASVSDVQGQPLFPAYRGDNPFKLHTEYAGALVVMLLGLGFAYSRQNRYWWFFAGLSLFFLTIAFGGHTPLYRLYYALLPGTQRFRAPSLSFFIVAFSLVVMAALTLERIAAIRDEGAGSRARKAEGAGALDKVIWIAGGVAVIALLGAIMTAGADTGQAAGPTVAGGWMRFAVFAALFTGVLWAWVRDRITPPVTLLLLSLLTVADLWIITRRFFQTVPPPQEMFAPDDVISFLHTQPEPFRMWAFPYPQPYRSAGPYGGNYPMLHDIEQVGGEHGNQLQRWNEYLGAGTETYIDWHNFVADAGVVNTPEGQAIAFRSVPGFLEAANVRFIVSMAPLAHPDLREVHRGTALVYEHTRALPRAYLAASAVPVAEGQMLAAMQGGGWDPRTTAFVPSSAGIQLPGTPLEGEAQVVEHTPDRVVVRTRANRPALLVLADNHYDGWTASIDGKDAPVVLTNHTFRGVVVGAGEREVVFTFEPRDLYVGFAIYAAGFTLIALFAGFLLLRRRRVLSQRAAAE